MVPTPATSNEVGASSLTSSVRHTRTLFAVLCTGTIHVFRRLHALAVTRTQLTPLDDHVVLFGEHLFEPATIPMIESRCRLACRNVLAKEVVNRMPTPAHSVPGAKLRFLLRR